MARRRPPSPPRPARPAARHRIRGGPVPGREAWRPAPGLPAARAGLTGQPADAAPDGQSARAGPGWRPAGPAPGWSPASCSSIRARSPATLLGCGSVPAEARVPGCAVTGPAAGRPGGSSCPAGRGPAMKIRSRQMSIGRDGCPACSARGWPRAPAANNAAAARAALSAPGPVSVVPCPEPALMAGTRLRPAAAAASRPGGPASSSKVAPTAAMPSASASRPAPASPAQISSITWSALASSVPVLAEMRRRRGGPKRRCAVAARSRARSSRGRASATARA